MQFHLRMQWVCFLIAAMSSCSSHNHPGHNHQAAQHFPATQDQADSRTHLAKGGTRHHTAFVIALVLNSLFVVVELWAGWYADTLALIADAVHNLGDVLALAVAWLGYSLSFRPPSDRFTYGMGRMSIYATVFNGLTLLVSGVWILLETVDRLNAPESPMGLWVISVAGIGFIINLGTAMALHRGSTHDVNIRGAWLHMMGVTRVCLLGLGGHWRRGDAVPARMDMGRSDPKRRIGPGYCVERVAAGLSGRAYGHGRRAERHQNSRSARFYP